MRFKKGDYVSYKKVPEVVWRVTEVKFNGGNPIIWADFECAKDEEARLRAFRKLGLAALSSRTTFYLNEIEPANAMLVVAMKARNEEDHRSSHQDI